MSTREDEIDEIRFGTPDDDEACIGSVLVLRKDCKITARMSLVEILERGLVEILQDLKNPQDSATPSDCQDMADYAHEAFTEGRPVTLSLTLMPEDLMDAMADEDEAEDAGDDGRLLN